ncbi:addiction module protein [Haliea sp. AH-315-K21]|uniref:Addiction module antitoxin RelB n=1 Tax=SAR86 cluster bacterium TaxID=2030880 RepID=A0A2A5CH82_9GAMM|nr:addiction module protein [Haliea sp. AH-315-K21]MBN4076005.1 addiction module protein [Gammaproteobacteria bacterium AH-315-E17]PCJ42861.1 MAG: hypothetical protein COA71_05020 [SAR86 cluster bacterium]
MNTAELETLRDAAMTLPEQERAKLASDLVASLDGPNETEVAQAWDIEVCRRINEIEKGDAHLLDVSEVLARARARLEN